MKVSFLLLVLSALLQSLNAAVDGALFRLNVEEFKLGAVRIQRDSPFQKRENPITISFADYRGNVGSVDVFIREGEVELLDPSTLTANVPALFEKTFGAYHAYYVLSIEDGVCTAGVLIEPKPSGKSVEVRAPGIYIAVRGRDRDQIASVLTKIVNGVEVCLFGGETFERLVSTGVQEGISDLAAVLHAQR